MKKKSSSKKSSKSSRLLKNKKLLITVIFCFFCILFFLTYLFSQSGYSLGLFAKTAELYFSQEANITSYRQGESSYQGTSDTTLDSSQPRKILNTQDTIVVQPDNWIVGLIKFDLASLPKDTKIESAYLELYLDHTNSNQSKTFTLNIHDALKYWEEESATWEKSTSKQKWFRAGAARLGKDISRLPISKTSISSSQTWYTLNLTNSVSSWIKNPESNYGIILRGDKSNNTEYHFASANHSNISLRPRLIIQTAIDQPIVTAEPVPTITPIPTYSPTPTSSPTSTPAPTATPTPIPPVSSNWQNINSWAYQLTGYQNNKLDQIANSKFNLVVIDLTRDGYTEYFSKSEIESVQNTGKTVLAYFEIGAIENYRPEWNQVPEDLKLGPVGGWPNEQYVKYWDERWWPIVKGRIDRAIASGYDGAYMDMVVTYEEIPASSAGTDRLDLADKMVDLIDRISVYAKSQNPNFKIVPQNSPELVYANLSWDPSQLNNNYLNAIDGLGQEELYYMATDKTCSQSWCQENRNSAAIIRSKGKLVLTIDYAKQASNITSAYQQSREAGFIPYVSVVNLNVLTVNPQDPQ